MPFVAQFMLYICLSKSQTLSAPTTVKNFVAAVSKRLRPCANGDALPPRGLLSSHGGD